MQDIQTKYIEVEKIEEIDEISDVYDITVEDNHNFFANNILVHNCLAGIYSNRILRGVAHNKTRDLIQEDLLNLSDRFTDAVGLENFKLELQFNKLEKQHVVNDYLIEHHKLTGIPLISTADSHYPTNDKWQARELYKKLGWLGKKDGLTLPAFEDLKCELYPKNAQQMWDEFLNAYPTYDFYKGNEELVKDSIERTHDIVWNDFEDAWIDTSAKLPTISVPNKTPFQHLCDLVKTALIDEGLHTNKEYVERAKYELSDIKFLGHEAYFITMYEIFRKAETKTLFGAGRGCFLPETRVKMADRLYNTLEGIKVGEKVLDAYGNEEFVLDKFIYNIDEDIIELEFDDGKIIRCTKDHKFLTTNRGFVEAQHLEDFDNIAEV